MQSFVTLCFWITHWALQGLKLWLFATVALLIVAVLCFPMAMIEAEFNRLLEPSSITAIVLGASRVLCFIVALAVGTAVFASMLNEHPLRPFVRRKNASSEESTTNKAVASNEG